MALAIAGTPVQGGGSGASFTLTYSVPAASLVVLTVTNYGFTGLNYATVSSVSDTGGLTWARRNIRKFTNAFGGNGTNAGFAFISQEIWWAYATAIQTSKVITVNITGNANEATGSDAVVFGVSGVTNTTAPWDTGGAAGEGHFSNASTFNGPASASYTTGQANSMILAYLQDMGSSGHGVNTLPTGYTSIKSFSNGVSPNFAATFIAEVVQAAAGAGTVTFGGGTVPEWGLLVDAISGTASGSNTDLSLVVNATGTITTTLSKANITGTAATEIFTGTIATHLTKISQTLAASTKITGTITTSLSKVSQLASAADLSVTGTISMNLKKVNQSAAALEIVTGAAVTNIDQNVAFHIIATTAEVFTGTITTRLGPIAQAVVAEEDIVGTVRTRLGSLTGRLVGTEIQALEIIQGPIVMHLGHIDQSLLAAKLGAAGAGKWYSYRYLDS